MNQRGEVVLRKGFSRAQLLHFTANLKVKLIGLEACGESHFLGRALREANGTFLRGISVPHVGRDDMSGVPAFTDDDEASIREWANVMRSPDYRG